MNKHVSMVAIWLNLLLRYNCSNLVSLPRRYCDGNAAGEKEKSLTEWVRICKGRDKGRDNLQTVSKGLYPLLLNQNSISVLPSPGLDSSSAPLMPPSNAIKIHKLFPGIKELKGGLFHASLKSGKSHVFSSVFVCVCACECVWVN